MIFELTAFTAAVLIAVLTVLLSLTLRKDLAEYAAFKLLTDSQERCRYFRRWTLRAAWLFGGSALLILMLTGRLAALAVIPPEFGTLTSSITALPAANVASGPFLIGVLTGVIALTVVLVVQQMKRTTTQIPATAMLGDVQALLPRNRSEGVWAAALSVNAGVSEELFFRLLLPLLLHAITGNALIAFAVAALLFGLVHLYQGFVGVVATTLLGCAMTALYLRTGQLWLVMLVHAVLDLRGMVLMPALGALTQRWRERQADNTQGIQDG